MPKDGCSTGGSCVPRSGEGSAGAALESSPEAWSTGRRSSTRHASNEVGDAPLDAPRCSSSPLWSGTCAEAMPAEGGASTQIDGEPATVVRSCARSPSEPAEALAARCAHDESAEAVPLVAGIPRFEEGASPAASASAEPVSGTCDSCGGAEGVDASACAASSCGARSTEAVCGARASCTPSAARATSAGAAGTWCGT